jgi:predicted nucleic acid-binding Zn ribbon protein
METTDTENKDKNVEQTYHCNDCGNVIYKHEVFCSKCGKLLDRYDFE